MRTTVLALIVVTASCSSPGWSASSIPSTSPKEPATTVSVTSTSTETDVTPPSSVRVASAEEIAGLLPSTPVTTAPAGAVRASILQRQEFALDCLRRHGFEGEITDDLGILIDVPPDQQDRYFEADAQCRAEEGERFGIEFGAESPDTLRKHYRAYLYVRECLIAEGYPTDQPPSLEVFVESGGAAWHPYNALMASGRASELDTVEQICPQDLFYLLDVLNLDG